MPKPKILLLLFLLVLSLGWLSSSGIWKRTMAIHGPKKVDTRVIENNTLQKARSKAIEARAFTRRNKFNTEFCFLVDMSLASGQNRFFIYDLSNDSLRASGLVTHGRCNEDWLEGRKYGNTVGCGCTSLGKYKVGYSYTGRFGLAYKLYGLDKSNDKAFQRFVVLHSHDCVPDTTVKDEICQSDGCPTVSPGFLLTLKPILKESKKPVLLWIYE